MDSSLTSLVKVEARSKGRSRWYETTGDPRTDGLRLPTVTSVLGVIAKPALIPWSNKQGRLAVADALTPYVGEILTAAMLQDAMERAGKRPEETRNEAAERGTMGHAVVQALIEGRWDPFAADWNPTERAFLSWTTESKFRTAYSEEAVYSPSLLYGGTVDLAGWHDEEFWLYDLKFGAAVYPEHYYQLAAYAQAWNETHRERVGNLAILHMEGDRLVAFPCPVGGDNLEAFRAALALYRIQRLKKEG